MYSKAKKRADAYLISLPVHCQFLALLSEVFLVRLTSVLLLQTPLAPDESIISFDPKPCVVTAYHDALRRIIVRPRGGAYAEVVQDIGAPPKARWDLKSMRKS